MPITLTPSEVEQLTGSTVTQAVIDLAADWIDSDTNLTPDEHVTTRDISESSVKAAWAIVAQRLSDQIAGTGMPVVSESQGDYSYTTTIEAAVRSAGDLLSGVPRKLLRLTAGSWHTIGSSVTDVRPHWFWPDIDQQADGFIR